MGEDPVLPGLWSLSPLAALVGVLVLVLLAVLSGRFIPERTHNAIVQQWRETAEIHKQSAAEWKAAHAESNSQVRELLPLAGTVADVFRKADMVIDREGVHDATTRADRGSAPRP